MISAVDSEEAKRFLTEKAIWYEKFLLNSIVSGLKTFSEMLIPHKSSTKTVYTEDSNDKNIDDLDCVSYFPYLQEHAILWGKQVFEISVKNIIDCLIKFQIDRESAINDLENAKNYYFYNVIVSIL